MDNSQTDNMMIFPDPALLEMLWGILSNFILQGGRKSCFLRLRLQKLFLQVETGEASSWKILKMLDYLYIAFLTCQ